MPSLAEREAELAAARAKLGFFKTPLTILRLFAKATAEFAVENALAFATSRTACAFVYPVTVFVLATRILHPYLYTPPDCAGVEAGALYYPSLYAYEAAWWLVLGILSSIGLGTGLHSGIMFLWPFCMAVILNAEACGSTLFSATYNHPCSLKCTSTADGSLTYFNTLFLLWPSVVLWGSGTAIGELPPYFITRAAKRAGARASEYEAEIAEAAEGTDLVSKLKIATISFTERHGFMGILVLASWPNAAFDMCGMACGWLEMPFWTFFGATLIGKGLIKVTLQTMGCIAVFGPAFWKLMLNKIIPDVGLIWPFSKACAAVDVASHVGCTLPNLLSAGRAKAMHKFDLQKRMLPPALLGADGSISKDELLEAYCQVQSICGKKSAMTGSYSDPSKYGEMVSIVERVLHAYDSNADGKLSIEEAAPAVGSTDGKLSLAALDPGTGGLISAGTFWSAFIAGLVLFFVYSIVEQVALAKAGEDDAAELDAWQKGGKKKAKAE